MHIALVVNASSGSLLNAGASGPDLAKLLRDAGLEVTQEESEADLPERVRRAAATPGVHAVVVAGGDGTIACAAQALVGGPLALGVVPLGTMNLLAKDVGVPLETQDAIAAIAGGLTREIDVGEVNGHIFLINSAIGMPARMARRRESKRGGMALLDRWGLLVSGVRSLTRYPAVTLLLQHEGRSVRRRTRALLVVVNDYEEGFGQIFKRATVDAGKLSLYVAHRLTPWRAIRLAFAMSVGKWRHAEGLERFEATRFAIRSRRSSMRVMSDGEVALIPPPLRYRVRPRSLRILVPAAVNAATLAEAAA